jgi:hypothetical protein
MSLAALRKQSEVEVRWGSWLKQAVMQISPKDLYLIIGRAGGKTTDFLAERTIDLCNELPGAFIAITADTYSNANQNIIPSLIEGWERQGWVEDIHFCLGKRPPKHFKKPYKPVIEWKHVISVFTGTIFQVVSQDRPSIGAGNSYQHQIGDEAKYLDKRKLDKLTAAIRGEYVRYGESPYYLGKTYTTDMPNPELGEHDWILTMRRFMDPDQIKLILEAANVINEIRIEMEGLKLDKITNRAKIKLAEKKLELWLQRWCKMRKNSVLFIVASALINIDNLRLQYFIDQLNNLGKAEFNTAILGMEPQVPDESKFYPFLAKKHLYKDGFEYDYLDQFKLGNRTLKNSLGLKYCDSNYKLDAGYDAGNMNSLVVGQTATDESWTRLLCEFCTVAPDQPTDLGSAFVKFFEEHQDKELDLWYDRAANNYSRMKLDFATMMAKAIEYTKDGTPTGWRVNLKSRNQGDITQAQEYKLVKDVMTGAFSNLPKLLIDGYNCPVLLSSMRVARVLFEKDRYGRTIIKKDKSSEKKFKGNAEKLIWKSTNMSDAFKYYICRPKWLEISSQRESPSFDAPVDLSGI